MPRGWAFNIKDILDTARVIFSGDDDFFLQELPPLHYKSDCMSLSDGEPLVHDNSDDVCLCNND